MASGDDDALADVDARGFLHAQVVGPQQAREGDAVAARDGAEGFAGADGVDALAAGGIGLGGLRGVGGSGQDAAAHDLALGVGDEEVTADGEAGKAGVGAAQGVDADAVLPGDAGEAVTGADAVLDGDAAGSDQQGAQLRALGAVLTRAAVGALGGARVGTFTLFRGRDQQNR